MVEWCWSEVIVRYDDEPGFYVGIIIHEKPVINLEGIYSFAILSKIGSKFVKKGWKKQRKLRNYVLYCRTSCSFATRSLKTRMGIQKYKIYPVSLNNHLYDFDRTIIKGKFPHMSREIFIERPKKKRK